MRPKIVQRGTDRFSIGMVVDGLGQLHQLFGAPVCAAAARLAGDGEKAPQQFEYARRPLSLGERFKLQEIVNRKRNKSTSTWPDSSKNTGLALLKTGAVRFASTAATSSG
jgi:hypothetical protein